MDASQSAGVLPVDAASLGAAYIAMPGHKGLRAHGYTADFRYMRDGQQVVEDVKSVRTREERDYIINRKLMYMLKGIYVHEVIR